MLDRVVLIKESGSHDPHVAPLAEAQHLFHKVLRDHPDVVVHEQEIFSLCKGHSEVVDGGIVELPLPAHHMDIGKLLLDLLIILEGLRLCTVIFRHDKFQVFIRPLLEHGADTGVQVCPVVLIGDDHRYQGLSVQLERGMIDPVIHTLFYLFRFYPHPLIMGHDGAGSCLKGIELALRVAGRGILVTAPVI